MHTPDLIDVNESSRITGLRAQTLYRLARQGQITSFRVLRRSVRFDRSELLALVRERVGARNTDIDASTQPAAAQ